MIGKEKLRTLLLCLALVIATVLAYQPAWHGAFIWDDDLYVTANPLLTAPDGLWRIWFSCDSPSQYFPLTYTTFYLERSLWGLDPAGYHWVNLILHAANALLVWRLLSQLRVPGAWLAAAIFALHPVQVESVAWITERKNVLMAFFFLLALLAWLKFIEKRTAHPGRYYLLALVFFALALSAKATACTLPAALLLILWLEKIPIGWRWLARVAPFVALGIGVGILTIWWERHHQGTQGRLFAIPWLERGLIASRAIWFYAGKLLWPANLAFSYPRWTISASDPAAYGWVLATAAAGVAVWRGRRWAGRSVEVAAAFFAVTLSPVLGFIMLYTFVYSFVADHYQYLACLGPIALAAAAMELALGRIAKQARWLRPLGGAVLPALLGALTWVQCGQYANPEALWRATLAKNPDSGMAHTNLGNLLLKQGGVAEAIEHLRKSIALHPDSAEARFNLGNALLQHGELDEAIAQYRKSLDLKPDFSAVFKNLGLALLRNGDFDGAMSFYEQTMVMSSDPEEKWYNLGKAFLNHGHLSEAIGCFRKTLSLNPALDSAWADLGLACYKNGQTKEAVVAWQKALDINPAQPQVRDTLASVMATASDASLRLDPNGCLIHLVLGRISLIQNAPADATSHASIVLAADATNPEAHCLLGEALGAQGKLDQACSQFAEALRLAPELPEAHHQLGVALAMQRQSSSAISHYRAALAAQPDRCNTLNNLAWLLATDLLPENRDGAEAVRLASRVCELTRRQEPFFLGTLAAAYAEAGRYEDAVATAQQAHDLAETKGMKELAARNLQLLALYRAHQPYREAASSP